MSERDLLNCLQEDTSRGIQMAIEMYGKSVKTICQSVLSGYSQQDIEEAISDTFVGLWKAKDKIVLDGESSLKSYLYGIARITALNRKRKLAKEQPTEDINEIAEPASTENLEDEAVQNSEYQILYQLILDMGSPDKEIFIYRYFQQNSVKEIAKRLALSAKTVENKLTRGRAKLKKQLLKSGIEAVG